MSSAEILQEVADEVRVCVKCPLHKGRKKAVPGEGPPEAGILFIGEGPGFYENEQGRPFVGAAGKFLDELLESIQLKRSDVFITNVVKCRPPGNRDPQPEEVTTCTTNYLTRQVEAINPRLIVTLGRFSMGLFLKDAKITKVHGRPVRVDGRMIVPMFHPAAALHQPSLRASVVEDFSKLPRWVAEAEKSPRLSGREEAPSPVPQKGKKPPEQMNLF